MTNIGRKIQRKREKLGLSQAELARRVGVAKSTIHTYENGRTSNIKHPILMKLSEVLDISPLFLMGLDDDEPLPFELSPEETQVLEAYNRLTDDEKNIIKGKMSEFLIAKKTDYNTEFANEMA